MSKAFSDKISQIVAHYPGLSYSPAFLEGPVTKFLLDRAVSEGYIHIFQIANRIHLQNSKYDAESTIKHNSANSSLKDGVLIFSSYDPDLKDVFDFLNQNFPEKHYASFWYEQCISERNEDADDSYGEDFMDLICKACCHSVSKYHFTNPIDLVTEDDVEVFGADTIEMVDEFALLAHQLNSTVSQKITLLNNNVFGEDMVEITKYKVAETYNDFRTRFRQKS
jgi:hypothetical protein